MIIEEIKKLNLKDRDIILVKIPKNSMDKDRKIREIKKILEKLQLQLETQFSAIIISDNINFTIMTKQEKKEMFKMLKESMELT